MTTAVQSNWRQLLGIQSRGTLQGRPAAALDPTVTVGNSPAGVAINPLGTRAYVANESDGTVSVINTATNTVIATIPVGTVPFGVAVTPDGTRVYVTNAGDNTVSVINTVTNTVTNTFPVGTTPLGIAITPDGLRAYVANATDNTVSVVSTVTNSATGSFAVGTTPVFVAFRPDGLRAYVTNNGSNNVSVIDTVLNSSIATVAVGTLPAGVAVTPDGSRVHVAHEGDNTVGVISTATNSLISTIPVGSTPIGVAIAPNGLRAFVTHNGGNSVGVISIATNTLTLTIPVGPGPFGVAVTPDSSTLYVTNNSDASVSVVPAPPFATSTSLTSLPDPSAFGQTKTLTATVTSAAGTPTGTVSFFDGVTFLGTGTLNPSGVATFTTSTLAVGSHNLTATYGGDANFSGSTSPVDPQTVTKANTSTSLTSAPNPSAPGQTVVLTATVTHAGTGTPTGTVSFFDGATLLGSSSLNPSGVATFSTSTLSPGTHTLSATYSGDANYNGSSGSTTQIVGNSTTTVTAAPANVKYNINTGQFYIPLLSATLKNQLGVGIPGQTITFTVSTITGPITLGTATTGPTGTATLSNVVVPPTVFLAGQYTASFAGAPGLSPSSGTAPLTFSPF